MLVVPRVQRGIKLPNVNQRMYRLKVVRNLVLLLESGTTICHLVQPTRPGPVGTVKKVKSLLL